MLNIGPQELIVVLIIALIVVGPQRLPELGRAIGRALTEFRKIQDDVKDTLRLDLNTDPGPESPTVAKVEPDVPPSPNGSQTSDEAGTDAEPRAAD